MSPRAATPPPTRKPATREEEWRVAPPQRKGPGIATSAACGDRTAGPEISRNKSRRTQGKPVENRLHWIGIRVSDQDREEIKRQLFRLLGKYDPRAIPRIISKRTGITEETVDYVLQMTVKEFEEWQREIRAALVRADEASAALWKRRSA